MEVAELSSTNTWWRKGKGVVRGRANRRKGEDSSEKAMIRFWKQFTANTMG